MNVLVVALDREGEDAMAATLAYRDWCRRFDRPNVMTADENLALLFAGSGRHDEAIPVLQRVHAAKKMGPRGSEGRQCVLTLINLSGSLVLAKRYAEAIQLLNEERPAACRGLGEDHSLCLMLADGLGRALFHHAVQSGDQTELLAGGAVLRDVILRSRKVLGSEHPLTHERETKFVRILEALEAYGCDADILRTLTSGILKEDSVYEPRSRPGPWQEPESAK